MKFLLISLLFLIGCNEPMMVKIKAPVKYATCYLTGFRGFPKSITGPITFELRNFITISVINRSKTERVEMTFQKSKCRARNAK